jgi:hypothetical protein
MTLRTVTELTLDYLTSDSQPDQEAAATGIAAAQQVLSQASQPVAGHKALPLTIKERDAVSPHIEEVFLEAIRPLTPQIRTKMVQEAARGFRALYVDKAIGEERATFVLNKLEQGGVRFL